MRAPCDEAQVRSRSEAVPCTAAAQPWILAATILGSSMAFIDGTVVNVALPVLQTTFHATVVDVQWVVESYGLFLSALILAGGALGDLFGRRRGLRPRVERPATDHRAQRARGGSSLAGSRQPSHHRRIFRREISREGNRDLVRFHSDYHRARSRYWWMVDPTRFLALGVLFESSVGRRGDGDFAVARARKPQLKGRTC